MSRSNNLSPFSMNRTVIHMGLTGLFIVSLFGCGGGGGGVMQERRTKGQMQLGVPTVAEGAYAVSLDPLEQRLTHENVSVDVKYMPRELLDPFFRNEAIFGTLAGDIPYPYEVIVFYVKVSNLSGGTIHLEPKRFVLVDDLFSQYSSLSPGDVESLYEKTGSAYGFAKTTAQAAPGIYGAGLGALTSFGGGKARERHMRLKQVTLYGGFVHDQVIYDGFIAFLMPHHRARSMTLVLPNMQMQLDPNLKAQHSVDFRFTFNFRQAE